MGTDISVFESGSGRGHRWVGLGLLVLIILLLCLFLATCFDRVAVFVFFALCVPGYHGRTMLQCIEWSPQACK